MNTCNKKYIIYCRKSKYTGKGESVYNQIDLCKQKIMTKYLNVNAEDIMIFTDEGFTGANTKRPGFQKMMELIRENKVRLIICYRLDRISRNVGDFCNLINELQEYGVSFLSIREDFDTSTPMGKAMMLICSVFAQLERDTIAERIRDNMLELAKTGRWLGGNTPTGFKSQELQNITVDGKVKKLFKLKEIPCEKRLVILLKDKYMEIKSQTGLETYTIQNNLKTKTGKRFTRWALVNILSNPVYAMADKDSYHYFVSKGAIVVGDIKDYDGKHGLMVYNKTNQLSKKGKQDNPVTEWIVAIGRHKGFWSGYDFVKLQELLELGANKRFRKPAVNKALLSGILKCSFCESFMRPKVYSNYTIDNKVKFSYLCELKDKSRLALCNHKNLNGNEADRKIIGAIFELIISPYELYYEFSDLVHNKFNSFDEKVNEYNTLTLEIKKNQKTINSLLEKIKLVPNDVVFDVGKEISKLKEINHGLEKRLKEFCKLQNIVIDDSINMEIALEIIKNYSKEFEKLDLVAQRKLIKLLISAAYSDGDNLIINLTGTENKFY